MPPNFDFQPQNVAALIRMLPAKIRFVHTSLRGYHNPDGFGKFSWPILWQFVWPTCGR